MQLSLKTSAKGLSLTAASLGALGAFAAPAAAQSIDVTVNIPRLKVAEYHKPYVAIWLEQPGGKARTLSVWYDSDMKNNEGNKWLRDIRQWWRVSGRSLKFPADGISSATRAPGPQKASFAVGALPAGQYTLVVEAAREVGGRELVRVPFAWPPKPGKAAGASGTSELGAISVAFRK